MAMGIHQSQQRTRCCTRKSFFLTMLFVNSFVGCIYYIHEQREQATMQNTTSSNLRNHIIDGRQVDALHGNRTTKAMEFIRRTLENEYDRDDLTRFYELVQREYGAGLKCSRAAQATSAKMTTRRSNRTGTR